MKKSENQSDSKNTQIPGWVTFWLGAIITAIGIAGVLKLLKSFGPAAELEEMPKTNDPMTEAMFEKIRPPSAEEISQVVLENQRTDSGFHALIRQETARAIRETTMDEYEKHNYHYIRYGILIAYIAALTQLPGMATSGLSDFTTRSFGIALTLLAIIIDLRNYYLFRQETRSYPGGIPWVTIALSVFYMTVLIWFFFTPAIVVRPAIVGGPTPTTAAREH